MKLTTLLTPLLVLGLAACGGGGADDDEGMIREPDIPDPATISTTTVTRANDAFAANNALPIPPAPVIGNASYTGTIVADVTGLEDTTGLYGVLNLRTGFANGNLTGSVTNLHTLRSGSRPSESLRGSLDVSGTAGGIDKNVNATASGTLNGVFDDEVRGDVAINTTLNGRVRGPSIFNPGEALTGTVSGTGRGSETFSINGEFQATQ